MFDQTWFYALVAGVIFYFVFFYKSRTNRLLAKFPTPAEGHVPLLGIMPFFLRTPRNELLGYMSSWGDFYGSVVRLWSPFGTALMVSEAKAAEKLFNSQTNITKGNDYDWVRPWLGDGLLMSTGEKWGHRRKMLTPAFHFKILEDFMQVFNAESQKMVKILKKECQSGNTFDIHHFVTRCALDIICETAMGTSINAQDVHDSDYIKAINEFGRLAQDRSFRPWLHFEILWKLSSLYKKQKAILKTLHGFTNKVIAERKAAFLSEKKAKPSEKSVDDSENVYFKTKRRLAFLDLLLEVQAEKGEQELSDVDIREETDTFMFEGHDTTSSNVSFTLYALGCYPQIQVKVLSNNLLIFCTKIFINIYIGKSA
ncbi:Cytochrome P450 4C1 [Folsomia candida]|uniref:Cytochrome P450 4C1 n=1 Tax=Folsomia candida TaxID=158441 RepID=A0A226ET50_FOLCA|nr:Cytochrome P450 4C1 [Folsomia candida]